MSLVQNLKYRPEGGGIDPARMAQMLDDALLKRNRKGWKTKKSFSPSLIGYGHGNCPRYWHMAFTGAYFDEENDVKGIVNMDYGTISHDRINKMFEESGIEVVDTERELHIERPPVFGFIDNIIEWDEEEVVGEIKTARQESWKFRQTSMSPTKSHTLQILLYMAGSDIGHGFFIYENKNTQELLIIPVEWSEKNQKLFENATDWMNRVYDNWSDWMGEAYARNNNDDGPQGDLPKRPYTKRSKVCKNCPLYNDCWSGPEGGTTIEELQL